MSVVIEVKEHPSNRPLVPSVKLKEWRNVIGLVKRADMQYHCLNLVIENSRGDFRITFKGHLNSIRLLLTDMLYLCEKEAREEL